MTEKADKKLQAARSSLRSDSKSGLNLSKKSKGPSKSKKVKEELPIKKLRAVYTILVDDDLPEAEDEKDERKKLLSAIKKALK